MASPNKSSSTTGVGSTLTDLYGSVKSVASSLYGTATTLMSTTQNLDRRARLRPKPGAETYVYGDLQTGILSVLRETNGMVWATTPSIAESHAVKYSSYEPVHSIAKFNNYERTDNVNLQVIGEFYVNNATEARYLLACLHFLRSVTLMDFGRSALAPGTPPPVLLFSAYGTHMYDDISVIVKNVSWTMPADVDYIQVPTSGKTQDFSYDLKSVSEFFIKKKTEESDRVWVPTKITISLTLEQQPTADWVSKEFNLNKFKNGEMLKGGFI